MRISTRKESEVKLFLRIVDLSRRRRIIIGMRKNRKRASDGSSDARSDRNSMSKSHVLGNHTDSFGKSAHMIESPHGGHRRPPVV